MTFVKTSTCNVLAKNYNVMVPVVNKKGGNVWAYKNGQMINLGFRIDVYAKEYEDVTNLDIIGTFDVHTYTYSQDDYVSLIINENTIQIIRRMKNGSLTMLNTNVKYIDMLFQSKKVLKDTYLFFTRISDDRIFERELSEDILHTVQNHVKMSAAIIIQKNIRSWFMQRRYNKKRMYLLLEIVHLPPNFVLPTFPGGTAYIDLFNRFNTDKVSL